MKNHLARGFTLLEVLIVITILSVIAMFVSQSLRHAVVAKVKIQNQLDDVSRIRDALRLINNDINFAYHYRDVEKEMQTAISTATKKASTTPPTPQPGAPPTIPAVPTAPVAPTVVDPFAPKPGDAPRIDPTTQFHGESDKINFVTMNHSKMMNNLQEADFAEVGYEVRSCKSLSTGQSSKCLYRRTDPLVDNDVEKGGSEVVLLENIDDFKLRYLGAGKQDWVSSWRTDDEDVNTKNKFPIAVEVTLKTTRTEGKGKKTHTMQIVSLVHFVNNDQGSQNERK